MAAADQWTRDERNRRPLAVMLMRKVMLSDMTTMTSKSTAGKEATDFCRSHGDCLLFSNPAECFVSSDSRFGVKLLLIKRKVVQ